MFYNALYVLPLWEGYPNRELLIYTIGSLCYIGLHGLLYSIFGDKSENIKKYRMLIYPVFVSDLLLLYLDWKHKHHPTNSVKNMIQRQPHINTQIPQNVPESMKDDDSEDENEEQPQQKLTIKPIIPTNQSTPPVQQAQPIQQVQQVKQTPDNDIPIYKPPSER